MTIFKNDNTQVIVSGKFIYENHLIQGIQLQNSEYILFNLEDITKVIFKNNIFLVKNYNSKKYLFLQISKGVLSLYKDKENYYLESQKFDLKEIPKNESLGLTVFKPGIVSVFINNCKLAVNALQNKTTNLTLSNLKKIINIYNDCNLSSEIQISDKVFEESNKPNDEINFGLSFGLMSLKNNYDNIIAVDKSNLNLPSVGVKVYFSPNILAYNDLNFNLSLDYFFKGQQLLYSSDSVLFTQIQFVKTTLGVIYKFNNLNTKIKPYIGTSGGFLFHNSKSRLSSSSSFSTINYQHNNALIYSINTGAVFKIFNKDIDFLIEFQPKLNSHVLRKSDLTEKDETYSFSSINFSLTYMF